MVVLLTIQWFQRWFNNSVFQQCAIVEPENSHAFFYRVDSLKNGNNFLRVRIIPLSLYSPRTAEAYIICHLCICWIKYSTFSEMMIAETSLPFDELLMVMMTSNKNFSQGVVMSICLGCSVVRSVVRFGCVSHNFFVGSEIWAVSLLPLLPMSNIPSANRVRDARTKLWCENHFHHHHISPDKR